MSVLGASGTLADAMTEGLVFLCGSVAPYLFAAFVGAIVADLYRALCVSQQIMRIVGIAGVIVLVLFGVFNAEVACSIFLKAQTG